MKELTDSEEDKMKNEHELIDSIEKKLSAWKNGSVDSETLCVAHCDEIDFFPNDANVHDLLKTLQDSRGMSREEALNYLNSAQFSSAAIH